MPSENNPRRPTPSKDGGGTSPETNTLWLGSLPPETGDADVMAAFAASGALDCATMRAGSRSYAFVLFRGVEEARAAMEALQGTKINGASIRIEFSRPARAVRNLWVGGISPSISKEQLEEEFLAFGKIECFAFFRDRNSAHVDFYKLEDAISAHKSLNGKSLGGEQLCVDFQRNQPSRTEYLDGAGRGSRGVGPIGPLAATVGVGGFHGSAQHGPRKPTRGRRQDSEPTRVLWIGYPPSVQIIEERLHHAMIAHGEVVGIKCYPSRRYAFVEFRTLHEACEAKKNLEGRLFNDPRIQIDFSSNEVAANKGDSAPSYPGPSRPGIFYSEGPFGPSESTAASNIHGPLLSGGIPGPNMPARPYGLQGYDPRRGTGYDFGGIPPNWQQQSSSATGILPSPEPCRPLPGAWDDIRETKRLKMEAYSSDATVYDVRRAGSEGLGDLAGFSHPDGGVPFKRNLSPVIRGQGLQRRTPEIDRIWRGIIAKGGSQVCRARCVPIGKGIDHPLPNVINCSARTGLDSLTEHYADAIGFDIVFFLPDSEEDFASYTEFLRYLGSKSRAGVVKLDKTTLFLVPPSHFLTEVLHVDGPERLYGVVLHFPQQSISAAEQPKLTGPPMQSYHDEREGASTSHRNYNVNADYIGSLHEDQLHHSGGQTLVSSCAEVARAAQSAPMGFSTNQIAAPRVEVPLVPDRAATLASVPLGTVPMPPSSIDRYAMSVMHDASMPLQGQRQEHQEIASVSSLEQLGNLPQHLGQQYNNQMLVVPHLLNYGNSLNGQQHLVQSIISRQEIQNPSLNMTPPLPAATVPPSSVIMSAQDRQFLASQSRQQYQFDPSYPSQSNYGMLTTNTAGNFNPPIEHQVNSTSSLASGQMGNSVHNVTQLPTGKLSMEFSQGQQPQTVVSGSTQGISEGDTDKNIKYQKTLQFAANLLLQLQQSQQQGNAQSAPGSGNMP